jgi:ketosteroid isomerase-like protein
MTNTVAATPQEVLERFHQATIDGTLQDAIDWYDVEGVHELPFAPPPVPKRIEGREQIRAFMNAAAGKGSVKNEKLTDVEVWETADPEVVISEYTVHGRFEATGEPFEMRNVLVLRVRNGKIMLTRSYFDPVKLAPLAK